MQNHSYENDSDLCENKTACRTHFHMKGFALRLFRYMKDKAKRDKRGSTRRVTIYMIIMTYTMAITFFSKVKDSFQNFYFIDDHMLYEGMGLRWGQLEILH